MKRILTAAILIACASPAMAAEQVKFEEKGYEAERSMLADNPIIANEVKQGVIDVSKLGIATVDVNGDGEKEVFVHDYNSYSCGTQGCSTYLMQKQGTQYLSIMNVIAGDEIALGDKSSGTDQKYRDIYIKGANGKPVRWSYKNGEYVFND